MAQETSTKTHRLNDNNSFIEFKRLCLLLENIFQRNQLMNKISTEKLLNI